MKWLVHISLLNIATIIACYKVFLIVSDNPRKPAVADMISPTMSTAVSMKAHQVSAQFTTYLSCLITLLQVALYKIASCFATSACTVFFGVIVDPITRIGQGIKHTEPSHRSHTPRGSGIPGRHRMQRSATRGRARPPPFRRSCVRRKLRRYVTSTSRDGASTAR